MSNICVQRQHQLSIQDLKEKIDSIMDELKSEIDFQSEWESAQEFCFRRRGAKGRIEISDSKFELNLNLGIMFRALKGSIEKRIVNAVEEHIV